MSKVLSELITQLALEKIEENLFRGQSQDLGWGAVFGGQVLGQALSAAVQTVPADRHVHSFHAYFLRTGDVNKPIVYDVDRARDGGSFTTRRVVAIQSGQQIFNFSASFQKPEPGFSHQTPMPDVPPPDGIEGDGERYANFTNVTLKGSLARVQDRPFELRTIDPEDDPIHPTPMAAKRHLWLRAVDRLPDSQALHSYLLAYVSDYSLVGSALLPHGVTWFTPGMQVASLDHAMWFHQPFRIDEWLLYAIESPSASGARGLARGSFYTQDGRLVATCAQEGLIRRRER
jgi:acyl-CoA thioesterase-2